MKSLTILSGLLLLLCMACDAPQDEPQNFIHDLKGAPQPWSNESFADQDGDFTFAIISDLNGGERERIFEVAVAQINLLNPEFVLSVGDLIDGGTEDRAQLEKEWESFDQRASKLKAPFFHLGGNHDLTNQVMREFWAERYGPRYYHFRYKDALFLMMDSEDYVAERMQEIYTARAEAIRILDGPNPELYPESDYYAMEERRTGEISPEQNEYFKEVLAQHQDVRWTFVLMHKPVWMREGGNNFDAMATLLEDRPYTLINGHFHSYQHHTRNERDHIILGTTGGSQNPAYEGSYDHITLVNMTKDGPLMANLKLSGILNKEGKIPLNGDTLKFDPF